MKYYPQNGSALAWSLAQAKGSLSKLRNTTHRFAEVFCNKPDECKVAIDQFFEVVSDIPHDLVEAFVKFLEKYSKGQESDRAQDGGTVQKNPDVAKKGAVDFTKETTEVKGNVAKAESIINSLTFASYDENNLCDLKEGIPDNEYDVTVDEIADLTGMPGKLMKTIKRARNFTGGNILAVNKLGFKADDGSLVFGRVAVIRRGKVLDMAYSLHSVEYELISKQDNAENLKQFSESLDNENDDEAKGNSKKGISMNLRSDFMAFFHKQAIDGFVKHCDYVLKTMNHGEDVVRALGVDKNGGTTREEKKNEWFPKTFYGREKDARMKGKKDGNYITTTNFFDMFCPLAFRTEIGINILYPAINPFY